MIDIEKAVLKVINRVLWTALATKDNKAMLAEAIADEVKIQINEWLKEQEVVGYLVLEPSTTMEYVSHYQPNNPTFKYDKLIALPSEVE